MTDTYESFIGPLHPGYYRLPSPENQKRYRKIADQISRLKCWATFTVLHPDLNAQEISELLDLEPDYYLEDGETIYQSDRYHIKQTGCSWQYEHYARYSRVTASQLLSNLLDDLHGKLPSIRKLQESGGEIIVQLNFEQYKNPIFFNLPPEILTKLFQLRAEFRFFGLEADFECDDEELDEDENQDDAGTVV